MYALAFDLVISDLQKYYGEPYNKAYYEIKELLKKNGFEWVQGSTYMTMNDDLTALVKTESKIIIIRDTQVILDRDVAELYGVTTKVVNQAIRNNPDKFPSGYVIELTNSEKEHVVKNFDHLETLKFSHATVKGFTEQGLYMLATILKSPMATATAIAIIDTFTQLRKLARTIDKVNEDAKEHGILPDKATEGKIQAAMNEVFADKLPLKMRRLTFGVNLGVLKFSIETKRESKE